MAHATTNTVYLQSKMGKWINSKKNGIISPHNVGTTKNYLYMT